MFHLLSVSLFDVFQQHKYVCVTLCHALFTSRYSRVYADNDIAITASFACNAPS